jgi:PAS domain S-box-containing protein
MEKQNEAPNARYAPLFENMLIGFAYCRMIFEAGKPIDFVYCEVNKAFGDLTGLRDVVGKRVTDVIPGIRQSNPEEFEIYGRVVTTGKSERFETYVDGLKSWMNISVSCPEKDHFIAIFENITERKQAEQILRTNEAKWKALFSILPVGITVLDENHAIVDFNSALGNILMINDEGLRQGKYKQRTYLHADGTPMSHDEFPSGRAVKEQRTIRHVEIGVIKEDGGLVWTEVSAAPLNLPGVACVVSTNDITGRKQMEAALQSSENKYHHLFESGSDAFFLLSAESGAILDANDIATSLYGYSRDEFLRLKNTDLSAEPEATLQRMNEVPADPCQTASVPVRYHRKKDGTVFPVEITGRFFLLHGQKVLFVASRDITDRLKAEKALRQSEACFREVLENSLDASYKRDLRLNAYEYLSPVFARMVGYTPDEMHNLPIEAVMNFMHPDDLPAIERMLVESMTNVTKKAYHIEYRFKHKDGQYRWLEDRFTVMRDAGGQPVARIGSVGDITERKRIEAELQKFKTLESLGVLAGGIAHDFNNILGGIFGYIDMAQEDYPSSNVLPYLTKAAANIDRARNLTGQLLTFAKGGAPVLETGRLFPFVKDVAESVVGGSDVSYGFDHEENLWACNFDKTQLGQAINHVVLNAKEAMPNGGTINIVARNIMFKHNAHSTLKSGDYVRISIKDNGIGMPLEILPRIFDPFFTTKPKGKGLGLATCYSIISRHGGAIDVESEQGAGSTFHIYLPACTELVVEPELNITAHTGIGTVIIMDDEAGLRDTIAYMLGKLGYSAICACDGKEALAFFIQETKVKRLIAALILDLTVPGGIGGVQTAAEIRKLNAAIPVFVASGYTDDPVMKNPSAYGFTASIQKPFTKNDLAAMLERYVQ